MIERKLQPVYLTRTVSEPGVANVNANCVKCHKSPDAAHLI